MALTMQSYQVYRVYDSKVCSTQRIYAKPSIHNMVIFLHDMAFLYVGQIYIVWSYERSFCFKFDFSQFMHSALRVSIVVYLQRWNTGSVF
jgi:hypothetical protein